MVDNEQATLRSLDAAVFCRPHRNPDDKVLYAEEIAEALCNTAGGTCDWEFDGDGVKYWFTKAEAWSAFQAQCVVLDWRVFR